MNGSQLPRLRQIGLARRAGYKMRFERDALIGGKFPVVVRIDDRAIRTGVHGDSGIRGSFDFTIHKNCQFS